MRLVRVVAYRVACAAACALACALVCTLACALVCALVCVPACGGGEDAREAAPSVLEIAMPHGRTIDPVDLTVTPREAVRAIRRLGPGLLEAALAPDAAGAIRVSHPSTCDATITLDGADTAPTRHRVELAAWIELGPDQPQLGFGAPVEVEARPGCREAIAGRVTWEVVEGAPLEEAHTERNGFLFVARTEARPQAFGPEVGWGTVPISPRTRAESVLEATWRGTGHTEVKERVRVAAFARHGGVPSIAPGQRVLLAGGTFAVREPAPGGSAAVVTDTNGIQTFAPDVTGAWTLADQTGRELVVRVGRHDETRLDCGRAECHRSAATHALESPMTHVLARGVRGELTNTDGAPIDPTCALPCHAVGEPGLADGGLVHAAWASNLAPLARGPGSDAWDAMPRALRRLGGVGCTTCHGPGAIPSPSARYLILRADVCAVCHDAPPRYGHVVALRASRMARSDADPRTREEPCAGCHTTSGYLARIGVRAGALRVDPPADEPPLGIACAACHAPHGETTGQALLRRVPLAEYLGAVPSAERAGVCVSCHAPLDEEGAPSASSAALALGRGGFDAAGAPLVAPGAHAAVVDGCVGCHATTVVDADVDADVEVVVDVERGAGHGFAAAESACAPCHADGIPTDQTDALHARARAILARLGVALATGAEGGRDASRAEPPHASGAAGAGASFAREDRRAPCVRNALLVLEDGAAGVHGASYARALLDACEGDAP